MKFQFRWAKTYRDLLPFCVYLYSIYKIYSRLLTSIVYYLYVSISIVLRLNDWSSFFYRFLQQWDRLLPPVQIFMKTVVEIFFRPIPTYVTQLVPKHFVLLPVVAAVSHIENIFVLTIMYTENDSNLILKKMNVYMLYCLPKSIFNLTHFSEVLDF